MEGGPWSGKRRATKFSSKPLTMLEHAMPQPKAAYMKAASLWVKQESSNHWVKKGKTVHGAVPGAPWRRIKTKDGYLKSCNTFGMLLTNTDAKPSARRRSAMCASLGSCTKSHTKTAKAALNTMTASTLNRQTPTPPTTAFAELVAARPNAVLPNAPVKKTQPKAEPRFEGAFLSATMLKSNGCTMPKPTPLKTRPTKSMLKDTAPAQMAKPTDQNSMPRATRRGLGKSSPKKPHGKANTAATQPFTVLSMLSDVSDAPKSTWNSVKNIGSKAPSMVQATLQAQISTNSSHCCAGLRPSTNPSSGSMSSCTFLCAFAAWAG
mmetsp:Transcript_89572/g.175321  ORF Transcript_89572/g.175321 Transcript_89572/m.175321 type:complete len:321 (-) Transcript_89572:106-1068(-)